MELELVSFKLCPFVQRSVITLNYKEAKYKITYIDLENPPDWFDKISPLGKVPVMKVNNETILFESAVINEFVDETHGTPLLPKDPLKRALERAWIEFTSECLMTHYGLSTAEDESSFEENRREFFDLMKRYEGIISKEGPYFHGRNFSLIDSSVAPLFMRVFLSDKLTHDPEWKKLPSVQRWGKSLMEIDAVKKSVVPEFAQLYVDYAKKNGSLLFK